MMEIEKKFAVTDLSQFKATAYEKFITDCYKYSKFKQSEAVKRINRYGKSEKTVCTYLSAINRYLQDKQRHSHVSDNLYNIVDKLVANSVQRLTPPKDCETETRKKNKVKENILTAKSMFVILQNSRIKKDFKTEEECNAYIEALRDMGVGANVEVKKIYFE